MYDKNILKLMYCNQHHYWTKNNLTFGLFGDEHSISSELVTFILSGIFYVLL